MRPRHDLIWDVLRFPTETSLWRCNRGNLSPDQVRLKALQPLQTNSKVLSPNEISAGSPICRRCSHHRPLSRRPSECHEPFQQGISRFSENQPDETVGHGSGCGLTSKHYNLGAWTGVFTWLRLPVLWLDNLWYSISGLQANGPTRSWPKIPKSRSTEPMFWARCCTAASPSPHLLTVREGLSFPNWSFQPHKALFENNQSERDITVFRDCRMPMKWKEIDDLIEARMFKTKITEKTKCKQNIII